tara:strand:- start:2419 stop:2793 length:375 start_codon:yes stop_codon:yes gene_type:complete
MKLALLFSLLLVSGCAVFGGGKDIPVVKPIEVITIAKRAPVYHPPLPSAIEGYPVQWTVLNPQLMEEYLADLEQGNAPTNVWYSLTTKGYENLSNNMADIKRYLRQILSIVDYYKKSDKTTEEE